MSREDYDSPNDVAWYLRDLMEKTDYGVQDYVTSVARTRDGAAFLVKFQTGKRLRVTVTEEPSVRFYPEEGEPDERERKEFEETFQAAENFRTEEEAAEIFRTTVGAPLSPEDIERIKGYKK